MLRQRLTALLLCSLILTGLPARAQQTASAPAAGQQRPAQTAPTPDPNNPVTRIMDEGLNRSKVMETLSYLSDVIGPRLTGSPQMKRANEWTRDTLASWGLVNAHVEPWGDFGRGWALKRFSAEVIEPQAFPVIAYPKAWSPGTGALTAEVVYVDAKNDAELEKYRGQLRGKIVLTQPVREVKAHFDAEGTRRDEKNLLALANAPDPATVPPRPPFQVTPEQGQQIVFGFKKTKFIADEGPALMIDSGRGDGGTVFVQSATVPRLLPAGIDFSKPEAILSIFRGGTQPYAKDAPAIPPQAVMSVEHYNRLVRMLQAGEKVRMAVNFEAQFLDQDTKGYNTVAEIPGTDLKDEIVMLGGHMDSWHAGTGATDNGAGVAVAMEAVRIIQALGLKPRRTIRIALWSGEEQGLLGSRGYVREHFGEIEPVKEFKVREAPPPPGVLPTPMPQPTPTPTASFFQGPPGKLVTKPEYEKFSAYFNLDNGTGKVRGVYTQGNAAVWPIFRQWLQPFGAAGASTLSMSNTGGTDHLSFDGIGLPGFQFIQDEIEYDTRTHHSNQDVFDRIQADDMKQAAAIMAAFVYQAATRDEKIPRKPAPGGAR